MDDRQFIDKFVAEPLFEDFYFFNVGREICEPAHHFGPTIREQYLLHYIVSGKGVFQLDGINYSLAAGEFFLLRPNQMGYYEADLKEPWTYCWLGFDGTKVTELLTMNGIATTDAVGKVSDKFEVEQLFNELVSANLFDISDKLRNQGVFLRLFSQFRVNEHAISQRNIEARNHRYSKAFMMYVQINYYRETLTITGIAESMNLNSSYLTQVIKEELKLTPIDYLTEYRISKARILLASTDLPVYDVAAKVGYKSSHTFSRVFKQKENCSPSDYARRHRK